MTDYSTFSSIVPATDENIVRLCLESNAIENIYLNDPNLPEVRQHLEAFLFMRSRGVIIKNIHSILMSGLIEAPQKAGEYRTCGVSVGNHVAPSPGLPLESMMENFANRMKRDLEGEYQEKREG